jgi:HSP20 family molecular chaperone IbpA
MSQDPIDAMWSRALGVLVRAEHRNRQAFRPVHVGWEPPVDLLETDNALIIVAALPGVRTADVELVIGAGALAIIGQRRLPPGLGGARVHRMELPYGRFERRVALPPGRFELSGRDLVDGCLTVTLRKLS